MIFYFHCPPGFSTKWPHTILQQSVCLYVPSDTFFFVNQNLLFKKRILEIFHAYRSLQHGYADKKILPSYKKLEERLNDL